MVNFLLSLDIRTWNQNCTLQLCLGWHGHYALKQSSLQEEEEKSCCCWLLLLLPKFCVVVDLLLLFCIIPVLLYYHDELMCGITIKTLNKVLFMCKIYELLITCLYFVHQQQSTWGGDHLLSGCWMMIPLPPSPQIISSLSVCLPPGAILLTNYKLWQVDSVGVEIVTGETAKAPTRKQPTWRVWSRNRLLTWCGLCVWGISRICCLWI